MRMGNFESLSVCPGTLCLGLDKPRLDQYTGAMGYL